MIFLLMNKNRHIATVECIGNYLRWLEVVDHTFMTNMKNILVDPEAWLLGRSSFVGRNNIITLQKFMGSFDMECRLMITKGISINDTLWFNSSDKPVTWEKVSPYRNPFHVAIGNLALNCKYIGGELRSPSPEHLIGGATEKCCKRFNNSIYMIKNPGEKWSSVTGNGAASEVIYTQLCKALNLDEKSYVKYSIGNGIWSDKSHEYSVSELFTNEQLGYIEFGDTKIRDLSIRSLINKFDRCTDGKQFRDMIIADAITFNIDRHRGNYGFLIYNDTFKIKSLAPIFDYDWCAFPNTSFKESKEEINRKIANTHSTGMNDSFINLARLAMYPDMYNRISNLAGNFKLNLSELGRINEHDENRSKMLELIINAQMRRILKYIEKG